MDKIVGYLVKFLASTFMTALFFVGCDSNSLNVQRQLALASTDPSHLLSIYASVLGLMFVLLLVFGGRGIWWSLIDAVCSVGLLSLASCPIYWVVSGHWKLALAVGISGLLALAGTTTLYWRYHNLPEKKPLFPEDENSRANPKIEEEE